MTVQELGGIMPYSRWDIPPTVDDKTDFRNYQLDLHNDIYGLGHET